MVKLVCTYSIIVTNACYGAYYPEFYDMLKLCATDVLRHLVSSLDYIVMHYLLLT